jgi:hypothetical protein
MWERREVRDALGRRCPFIGAWGGRWVTIMAGIRGETVGGVNDDLSALKLRFKGGGGLTATVSWWKEGVLHQRRGWPWRLGRSGGALLGCSA